MRDFSILIVDDDIYALENMKLCLEKLPLRIETAADSKEAEKKLRKGKFNLLITDYLLPCKDGLELSETSLKNNLTDYIILITGYGDENVIERAIKVGIRDFLRKPYRDSELINSVKKIHEEYLLKLENEELKKKLELENTLLRRKLAFEEEEKEIIGENKQLKSVLKKARQIARYSENILIQGESGTGKELIAQFIHQRGPRKLKPFIEINAASLNPSLFESELFGYNKGAFTDAHQDKLGLFELADGGILFLDEISEIPFDLQAKLLRVIETGKIRRVGGTQWKKVDVQLIATTNRSINEIKAGKFIRQDLFHRLANSVISIPPLRERKEDIPLLLNYYFNKFNAKYGRDVPTPTGTLLKELVDFEWCGNVRQLVNFVKNVVLFGEVPSLEDLHLWLSNGLTMPKDNELTFSFLDGTIEELEKAKLWLVKKILQKYNYNKAKTARHLGMSYPGLHALIKKNKLM